MRTFRVGLLGFGTVGGGVFRMLADHRDRIARMAGGRVEIARVAVRDLSKPREARAELFSDDPLAIAISPDVDVVVEVMGGLEPAGPAIEAALRAGKPVVTANKELIAKRGEPLLSLAEESELDLTFEAAVAGGTPVIGPIRRQLAGDEPLYLGGILNGTTHYILTEMTRAALAGNEASFAEVLAEAQRLGYAEADPTSDVDGFDSVYKLAILTSIATGRWAPLEAVARRGIRAISAEDVRRAIDAGRRIKLLAQARRTASGAWELSVAPASLPLEHPLAQIEGATNGLIVRGAMNGEVRMIGPGAGAGPTATSVVGDLIEVCRSLASGSAASPPGPTGRLDTRAPGLVQDDGAIPELD